MRIGRKLRFPPFFFAFWLKELTLLRRLRKGFSRLLKGKTKRQIHRGGARELAFSAAAHPEFLEPVTEGDEAPLE